VDHFVVVLLIAAAATALSLWFGWRLATIVRADGYGFLRASSGLPRDWAPPDLPSTPYSVKPHR
jgi:hypothetical protein